MPTTSSTSVRFCLLVSLFVASVTFAAQTQEYLVIHNFTGGVDGGSPMSGVILDRGGNLYGTTFSGGAGNCSGGCGVVYKMSRRGGSWVFSTLYMFRGGADGWGPAARVVFGPDGALYGTTALGGNGAICNSGCGTVFRLQPPARACASVSCPWTKTILYNFQRGADGGFPYSGDLLFDRAGNIYGTTVEGGSNMCGGFGCGTVYELTPAHGGWQESILYSFHQPGNVDGAAPYGGLIFDQAGNLYGTTSVGGLYGMNLCSHVDYIQGCGVVFELTPSNGSWSESVLYNFTGGSDGGVPESTLLLGPSGVLYGTTAAGGTGFDLATGTVFQLAPSGAGWSLTTLEAFMGPGTMGPNGGVISDLSGNLFGANPTAITNGGGPDWLGVIFQLSPSGGGWTYNQLYGFPEGFNGDYGMYPASQVVLDNAATLYGTAAGGNYGAGIVWSYPQQ